MGLPFENADYDEDQIGATKIPELTDVSLSNLANNEILVYNSTNNKWENKTQGSTSINDINDINNVNINNLQDGQRLVYDLSTNKWINSTITDANTDNLNDLTDTDLTTPFGDNEVLKYDQQSGKWINGNIPIEKLSNVNISSLQNGEVLKYDQSSGKWINSNRIDTLNELDDVTIGTNVNNHVLKYDQSTGVYKNQFVNLTELADTNITTLNNNNILIYNSSNQKWEPGNITYTETDPTFTSHTSYNITDGTGFLKNNGSGTWTYDNNTYLTSANIYQLGGLTWSNLDDNELIRRSGSTSAEGAGMKLTDLTIPGFPQTAYRKTISYFNRVSPANIQFGGIVYEYTIVGYNQRIVPHSPLLTSSTDGLYLHYDNTNINVGINTPTAYPSKTFQVGTTLYVDDINKKIGINKATPSVDLEVLNTMYVDSNTRRVGIVNSSPATTLQVGTTLYVNETTRRVGIGIQNPDENLEVDGSIQIDSASVARLKFQQSGQTPYALAEIDAEADGNGGQLEFYTSENGTSVAKKMIIRKDGATEIYTEGLGLAIYTNDGFTQQTRIYNGSTGDRDLIIDTDSSGPSPTNKGISFRTQSVQRLRIGYFGELGVGAGNSIGNSGELLKSNGFGNNPTWTNTLTNTTTSTNFNINSNLQLGGQNGISGQVLTSQGGSTPIWSSVTGATIYAAKQVPNVTANLSITNNTFHIFGYANNSSLNDTLTATANGGFTTDSNMIVSKGSFGTTPRNGYFKIPVDGIYRLYFQANFFQNITRAFLQIWKIPLGTGTHTRLTFKDNIIPTTTSFTTEITGTFQLVANDEIYFNYYITSSTSNPFLNNNSEISYIEMNKIN